MQQTSIMLLARTPRWTPDSDVFTVCTVVNAPRTVRALGDVSLCSTTLNIIQPYTRSSVAISVVAVHHGSCTVTPTRSMQTTVVSRIPTASCAVFRISLCNIRSVTPLWFSRTANHRTTDRLALEKPKMMAAKYSRYWHTRPR